MASITSVNAVYMITIPGVFPDPQQLQGFAVDDIFTTDAIDNVETMMGVDGNMSAGFVFVPVKQSIALQADSPSNDVFYQWYAAQQALKDIYFANGVVVLPGLGKKWTMTRGVLSSYHPMPDMAKVAQPQRYSITWNKVSPAATV
jgi:hypothetical protein